LAKTDKRIRPVDAIESLDELREILNLIADETGITRTQIADFAGLGKGAGPKVSRFLKNRTPEQDADKLPGVNGVSALALHAFAIRWLKENSTHSPVRPKCSDGTSEQLKPATLGTSRLWPIEVKQENRIVLPGELCLVVAWLNESQCLERGLMCFGLATGTGNRMIVPKTHGLGKKVQAFIERHQGMRPEQALRGDSAEALVARYIDASWFLKVSKTSAMEYELLVHTPRRAIQRGGEIELWVPKPNGPNSVVLSDPRKMRSPELMEIASTFPELLDEALGIK